VLTAAGLGALCVFIAEHAILSNLDSHILRLLAMLLLMLVMYVLPALALDTRLRAQIFHRGDTTT